MAGVPDWTSVSGWLARPRSLYRALLRPLYPGKEISSVLLFTETPRLIALPAAALDDALARLT